ncbi:MAG: ABC transporter ATP-binding protein [Desulfomonile tiedjei]|nr:ABC transporter ATP-binding protein [Desulfomonile tiedjei]
MNEIIKTHNLCKSFQGIEPARNVNISVNRAEFVTLLGPSGSGKSTLLALMGGLESPSAGTVFLEGQDLSQLDEDQLALLRRDKVGFVFQTFNLIPTLPAIENVGIPLYPTRISSQERRDRARALLKKVGLEERSANLPSQLSGGERQRVAIARALINEPSLVLCDEPTGNLDSKTGQEIIDLLRQLNSENGVTLFMVTHDKAIAKQAHRSLFMNDGEVRES